MSLPYFLHVSFSSSFIHAIPYFSFTFPFSPPPALPLALSLSPWSSVFLILPHCPYSSARFLQLHPIYLSFPFHPCCLVTLLCSLLPFHTLSDPDALTNHHFTSYTCLSLQPSLFYPPFIPISFLSYLARQTITILNFLSFSFLSSHFPSFLPSPLLPICLGFVILPVVSARGDTLYYKQRCHN